MSMQKDHPAWLRHVLNHYSFRDEYLKNICWHWDEILSCPSRVKTAVETYYKANKSITDLFGRIALVPLFLKHYELAHNYVDCDRERGRISWWGELRLSELAYYEGKTEKAFSEIKKIYQRESHARNGFADIAWTLHCEDAEKAINLFERDLNSGHLSTEGFILFAQSLIHLGDTERASEVMRYCRRIHANARNAYPSLARRLCSSGYVQIGWEYYEAAIKTQCITSAQLIQYAESLALAGQIADAAKTLKRIEQDEPALQQAQKNIANILCRRRATPCADALAQSLVPKKTDGQTCAVYIIPDDYMGYAIQGEKMQDVFPVAVKHARIRYLTYYASLYSVSVFRGVNAFWSESMIDPKDTFRSDHIYYLFFVMAVVRNLARKEKSLSIRIDRNIPRHVYQAIISLCHEKNIPFSTETASAPSFLDLQQLPYTSSPASCSLKKKKQNEKREWQKRYRASMTRAAESQNIVLLHVFQTMRKASDYIKWRYGNILEDLRQQGYTPVLFTLNASPGFINDTGCECIHIAPCVTRIDYLRGRIWSNISRVYMQHAMQNSIHCNTTEWQAMKMLAPKEIRYVQAITLDRIMKRFAGCVILQAESLLGVRTALMMHYARKYGCHVISIAGRIYSSNRITNRIHPWLYQKVSLPALPNTILVKETISAKAVLPDSTRAGIPLFQITDTNMEAKSISLIHRPFLIVILTQGYRDNLEQLVIDVLEAAEPLADTFVMVKPHPLCPLSRHMLRTFSAYKAWTCQNAVEQYEKRSGASLCISSYSTAALEHARQGLPVIWAPYITINSLICPDICQGLGVITHSAKELQEQIYKLHHDSGLWQNQAKIDYDRAKSLYSENQAQVAVSSIIEQINRNYPRPQENR